MKNNQQPAIYQLEADTFIPLIPFRFSLRVIEQYGVAQ